MNRIIAIALAVLIADATQYDYSPFTNDQQVCTSVRLSKRNRDRLAPVCNPSIGWFNTRDNREQTVCVICNKLKDTY